jgi:hypothetical protein
MPEPLRDDYKRALVNGLTNDTSDNPGIVTSISQVPVTMRRKSFVQLRDDIKLPQAGTARANIAASRETADGTTKGDWASRHRNQTVLQQHCDFFDRDRDGIIRPRDTYFGFRRLGFGVLLSLLAMAIIHLALAYPTQVSWVPDPRLRIHVDRIHHTKHGSDTGTYDGQGRFVPQHFEDIFAKYAAGRDYITLRGVVDLWRGQRCLADPFGWTAVFFEWLATYLLLWPEDGRMMKEDIRGIYDGSLFYTIAARREARPAQVSKQQQQQQQQQ